MLHLLMTILIQTLNFLDSIRQILSAVSWSRKEAEEYSEVYTWLDRSKEALSEPVVYSIWISRCLITSYNYFY